MKDIYDLTGILNTNLFPWSEIPVGIARSVKKASIFYGHNSIESDLTMEQQVWHNAITASKPIKGLDILLTQAKSWHDAWYKLGHADHWIETDNFKHFPRLQKWLTANKIFKEIGRQIVFIQLQNAGTPRHVDQDLNDAPEEFRQPSEFIWITSPNQGKKLFVNNVQTPHITWFNSYTEHYTQPEDGIRWSIRIDGKFTEEFKKKL
jgi:hypothetical protein